MSSTIATAFFRQCVANDPDRTFTAETEVKLTFRLTDRATAKPLTGLHGSRSSPSSPPEAGAATNP
jgi:hypothetical protein